MLASVVEPTEFKIGAVSMKAEKGIESTQSILGINLGAHSTTKKSYCIVTGI